MRNNKSIEKIATISAVAIAALIIVFSSFYTVGAAEEAVITTFGRTTSITGAGLHFKVPFIQKVHKVSTASKGMAIGYYPGSDASIESESLMITKGLNFVNVDFYLTYQVCDSEKFLYASDDPEQILKNIVQGCIRSVIGNKDVDAVITDGKAEIQDEIRVLISSELEKKQIGLSLINIAIQDAEPPTEAVKEAFKAVENAKQGKETAKYEADKYEKTNTNEVEAKVDMIKKNAEAQAAARVNEANGQVARFNSLYEEYKNFPLITKQRMFYEAMQEILPNMTVYIDTGDGNSSLEKLMLIEPVEGGH